MTAEIVSIGTELLLGQIVDTDAPYLAQQLSALGISVYHRATVGDNTGRAVGVVKQALSRADLVILIGGLGPTMDDLTRDVFAEAMDAPLVRSPEITAHLTDWFARRGYTMPETNLRQADVPTGALPLPNPNGTAPGLLLEKDGKTMVALPGPPNELIPMFEDSVFPYLRERTSGARQVIRSKTLRIVGMGESAMEELVSDLMHDANPTVAPYAKLAEVHLRVTSKAETEDAADEMNYDRAELLKARLGNVVYGEDETLLEEAVVALLQDREKTVATAESCTGGLLSGRITAVAGSSAIFHTGIVSYSNETKIHLLKVPSSLLGAFGAVSAEVAQSMAERVRELAGADYGLSVTGIAGPGGGSEEKPVGLVYIGLSTAEKTLAKKNLFIGNRADIRYRSTQTALDMLRQELLKT